MQFATSSLLAPALSLGLSHYLANRLALSSNLSRAAELKATRVLANILYGIALIGVCAGLLAHETVFCVAIAISAPTAVFLLCSSLLRGLNFPKTFATLTVFVQVIALLCLGLTVSVGNNILLGAAVFVGMSAAPLLVVNILARNPRGSATPAEVSRVLTLAATLVPHLVMAVATMLLMRLLVGIALGTAAAANYMFASLLIGGSLTIGASLDAHWSTRAQAATTLSQLSQILERNQARIQTSLLLVSLAATIFILAALNVWLPSSYDRRGVVVTVALGMSAAAFQAAADGRSALLMWLGKTFQISVATAAGGLSTLGLALLVLPLNGWQVAGLCIAAGMAVRAVLATIFSLRTVGFRRFDLYVGIFVALQLSVSAILFFQ